MITEEWMHADEIQAQNANLASKIHGQLILAPLTRGTHVPFRRLCHSFGCQVAFSEMAYARPLVKYGIKASGWEDTADTVQRPPHL